MAIRRKQSFLHGAFILGGATLAVKCMGACFKIPLTNLIGGMGMADFNAAYDIFNPLNALAVAGLPVAVAKLTSESMALGRFRDARKLLRLSMLLFVCTGVLGALAMGAGAPLFARAIGSPASAPAIAALAPAVFFFCVMSAYRGYYQGLKNMYPTAVSQLVEALCKLAAGVAFSVAFMRAAAQSLAQPGGWARGLYPVGKDAVVICQAGAVGAICGVALSTAAGAAYLWIRHHLSGDGLTRAELAASPAASPAGALLRRMARIAIPVCLGALTVHLTSMIDLFSIMNRLAAALRTGEETVLALYRGRVPAGYGAADMPKYLFGCYSAIAVNIFNLVPSLTATLGVSILPAVAGAWAMRRTDTVQRQIESALRVTALVAMPAGLSLAALAGPVTALLYGSKPMEAAVAAELLRALGLPMILVALATPINAALQAVGQVSAPVKFMVAGGAVKLLVNYALVGLPGVNIRGAPVGTFLCYLLIVALGLRLLARATGIRLRFWRVFGKPLLAGGLCAGAAWATQGLLARVAGGSAATFAAIAAGSLFYAVTVLFTRTLQKDEVLMLPKGEKVVKILEKHGMIG